MVVFEIFDARELLSWPSGDNSTDTEFGNVHFNLTTLEHYNYTYYESNRTLSNGTKCWLTFEPYEPALLYNNGSFVNATTCYSAIDPIGTRGHVAIAMAVAFGIALVLNVTVLAKHGKMYLPREKRFYPIGRRWQWYWGCFACAVAIVSLFTTIDVDRYYVQELPITITVFFWFLLCMGTVALVWEAARHWGSWLERQYVDPNPFVYQDGDGRSKTEFWMPLWFYFWLWLNFFLVVPRSWKFTQLQRSAEQTAAIAIPAATSGRFKAAGFCLVVCWLTILFSLRHSISFYKDKNRGIINRTVGFWKAMPLRFMLIVPLCGALIAYQIFISFVWKFSVIRVDGYIPAIFAWGYAPALLIVLVQVIYGYASPNEDKELLRQRRVRGETIDRELGLVHKPAWWRRVGKELSMRDRIARNVHEIGGGRATGRRVEETMENYATLEGDEGAREDGGIEMHNFSGPGKGSAYNPRAPVPGVRSQQPLAQPYGGRSDRRRTERTMEVAAGILFPNTALEDRARREAELGQDGPPPPPYSDDADRGRSRTSRTGSGGRSNSAETTNSITAPPQQVKSMLDI